VAGDARKAIEEDTGRPVITSEHAADFAADVLPDSVKTDKF